MAAAKFDGPMEYPVEGYTPVGGQVVCNVLDKCFRLQSTVTKHRSKVFGKSSNPFPDPESKKCVIRHKLPGA